MISAIYYVASTGEAHSVLSGPDLGGFPSPLQGDLAVLSADAIALPGYIADYVFVPLPSAPSPAHTWDWDTKQWTLPLAAAKEAKWTSVKAARDAREFGPFTWNGHTFDGDRDAQRRLTVALEAAKESIAAGTTFSTFWKLADNTIVTLSAQDVVDVYRACGEHNIRDNHADAAAKYALIQAATTIEDLDAI